ncbi:MAG: CoB--CoM heterodisulfide reductase subunit B [Promethearchaeota archaeon]|nr:MAG: CoB--CoM heterodisulfide reductase subunit B [Candidatus Lokiarchaeota archaeon]
MEYDLFLGCVIPARLPFLEASARKVFHKLGIGLKDVEGFSCCPDPTGIELIDHNTWLALGARNLSLVNNNREIISLCSGCVETLKGVNYSINNSIEKKEEINNILKRVNKSYTGNVQVKHFAEVIYENIDKVRECVKIPLEGFKIAAHYGCHYLRPSKVIKWDDPLDPSSIDEIIDALGAESINYDLKMECCGNPVEKSDEDLSLQMINNKLNAISKAGANCVTLVCPACFQQFDFKQRTLNKKQKNNYNLPIFYLSELIALAFGFNAKNLGFRYHRTRPIDLFNEIGFSS